MGCRLAPLSAGVSFACAVRRLTYYNRHACKSGDKLEFISFRLC
jgi:hypothetical protein